MPIKAPELVKDFSSSKENQERILPVELVYHLEKSSLVSTGILDSERREKDSEVHNVWLCAEPFVKAFG